MSTKIDKVLQTIQPYKYISFDLFDTLVFRNVSSPNDIFQIVDSIVNSENYMFDFYNSRIKAQEIANKMKTKEEFTIDDIYKNLDFPLELDGSNIKEIELNSEYIFSLRNIFFDSILNYCSNNNKIIIITTDVYLPKDYLAKMLLHVGIRYDYLFVSSEYGKRKSKGSLFRTVLKELSITESEIIHLGDNIRSDFLMPRSIGIRSILYKRDRQIRYNYSNNKLLNSILNAVINNSYLTSDYYNTIGFQAYGPLLCGFVQWIKQNFDSSKADEICFFARDGFIIKKTYNLLFPSDNTEYLYVSRRSLTVPRLIRATSIEDVLEIVPYIGRHEYPESFLSKLGINSDDNISIVKNIFGDVVSREKLNGEEGLILFEKIKNCLFENSTVEMNFCKEYLLSVLNKKNVLAVDLGWYGTIQKSIDEMMRLWSESKNVGGLYLGRILRPNEAENVISAKGFVFDVNDLTNQKMIFAYSGLIEIFFSANHGTTINYVFQDGIIKPVLDSFEQCDTSYIETMQNAAVKFSMLIAPLLDYACVRIDGETAFKRINSLLCNPKPIDIKKLGSLKYFEKKEEKIIDFKGTLYYLLHPSKIISDYEKSYWKTGFIKRLIPFIDTKKTYLLIDKLKNRVKG